MRLPVVIQAGGRRDFAHLCRWVSGLSFSKEAPGGDTVASMRLGMDPDLLPDLDVGDRVIVLNPRTGVPLWCGYVDDTGRHSGGFDLQVTGGRTVATDERQPLVYVDRSLEAWTQENVASTFAAHAQVGVQDDPDDASRQGVMHSFPPGMPVASDAKARSRYHLPVQGIASVVLEYKAGLNSTDYRAELRTFGTSGTVIEQLPTAGEVQTGSQTVGYYTWNIAAGVRTVTPQLVRDGGATNVATDTVWLWVKPTVMGARVDRYGTLLTAEDREFLLDPPGAIIPAAATGAWLTAQYVIEDLLGRLLKQVDPSAAAVDLPILTVVSPPPFAIGTNIINQLAYRDPVTAAQILDDLTLWEPDYYWAIDAPTTFTGGHRFRALYWDHDRPRYTIRREDGYTPTSEQRDLANRITVTYTTPDGSRETYVHTATVPELGARIRDADPIELPEGIGSLEDAQRIAEATLAATNDGTRSGSAAVHTTTLDHHTGLLVEPYEIEAGYTAHIVETGEVARVTEVTYNDDDQTATLTLGTPALTMEQRIQHLSRRR